MTTPEIVTAFIGLSIIVVVALLRDRLGPSGASSMLEWAQSATHTADMYLKAADQAVTEVEYTLKKYQDVPDEQLKAEAARIMTDILKAWGVYVDPKAMSAILAMVEAAYQRLKEVKAAPLYKYQVNG
jgi:hypothetical protein